MNDGFFLTMRPHYLSQFFGAKFDEFEHASGCTGLARMSPVQLEVLAVLATKPGQGQFRAFVAAAQERFNVVIFLEVMSQHAKEAMHRYGFRFADSFNEAGEPVKCMVWRRDGQHFKQAGI